eukprot:scaffold130467_cov42-Phaeocystis_antarctica.AAC.1
MRHGRLGHQPSTWAALAEASTAALRPKRGYIDPAQTGSCKVYRITILIELRRQSTTPLGLKSP